jgi:hypothetical protein
MQTTALPEPRVPVAWPRQTGQSFDNRRSEVLHLSVLAPGTGGICG